MVGDDDDDDEEVDARLNSCVSNLAFPRMHGDKNFLFLIFTAFYQTRESDFKI